MRSCLCVIRPARITQPILDRDDAFYVSYPFDQFLPSLVVLRASGKRHDTIVHGDGERLRVDQDTFPRWPSRPLASEPLTGAVRKEADGLTAEHAAFCCPPRRDALGGEVLDARQ